MNYLLETIKRTKEQYLWERVDGDWKLVLHKLRVDKNWKHVSSDRILSKNYKDFPKANYQLMSEKDLFVLFL